MYTSGYRIHSVELFVDMIGIMIKERVQSLN